jgi:spore coat polysaccharide biosynthesis protein SpsF
MNSVNKTVVTIEGRMTSSRLPGKILMKACEKPVLELLVERLRQVKNIDGIVIATTANKTDDPVEKLANSIGIKCFRGSEEDVLKRVLEAARSADASTIVEITGDCPLIDPEIVSQVIELYNNNICDYASNIDPSTFPIGMDVQVFSTELLALADKETDSKEDREHVSWFIRRQPDRFTKISLPARPELHWPELEITLDEKEDFELIKKIFEHFYPENRFFSCLDIVRYIKSNPGLLEINGNIQRDNYDVSKC